MAPCCWHPKALAFSRDPVSPAQDELTADCRLRLTYGRHQAVHGADVQAGVLNGPARVPGTISGINGGVVMAEPPDLHSLLLDLVISLQDELTDDRGLILPGCLLNDLHGDGMIDGEFNCPAMAHCSMKGSATSLHTGGWHPSRLE